MTTAMIEPAEVASTSYIRFQSASPNARGGFPGVFALANALAAGGRLSAVDVAWWRSSNDWGNNAYPNPSATDPSVFDRDLNPAAASWFRATASDLVLYARGYVALVERYGVVVEELHTSNPGTIIHADAVQVVALAADRGRPT